jgi:hypothetical protein
LRIAQALDAQRELLQAHPTLQVEEHEDAWREGLRAQRAMLAALLRDSVISEEVYEELVTEGDAALQDQPEAQQIATAG